MEFSPTMFNTVKEEALTEYFLSRIDQVNERDLSDPLLAQDIFLLKHRKELSEMVEKRLVPKILQDIGFILQKGWGKKIARDDFNHVHLCCTAKAPLFDLGRLLSEEDVRLFYHTLENIFLTSDHANRNIISSLRIRPVVIPIHLSYKKMGDFYAFKGQQIGISAEEIGLNEYAKIEFEQHPNGPYKLENGIMLNMRGVLGVWLFPRIKFNREKSTIEFEGKAIGRAEWR
jgi:hypothetical protein